MPSFEQHVYDAILGKPIKCWYFNNNLFVIKLYLFDNERDLQQINEDIDIRHWVMQTLLLIIANVN